MKADDPQSEPILERLRRGDFGAAPFAQTQGRTAAVLGQRLTSDALAQLRAGARVEYIGSMYGGDHAAVLHRVAHEGRPLCLLVVTRADALTDISASADLPRPALRVPVHPAARALAAAHGFFFGVSLAEMERNAATFRLAGPWTAAATFAIELSVAAAWPEHDMRSGFSSGGRIGSQAYYAVKATKAEWQQLDAGRRSHIVNTVASTAARIYGLTQPDRSASEITLGIQLSEPQAAGGQILTASLTPGAYLAQKTVAFAAWHSNPPDPLDGRRVARTP